MLKVLWSALTRVYENLIYEKAKEDTIPDVETIIPKETPPPFKNKVDYRGDTNEKTHGSDDYPSETDGCERKLAKERENEEDWEFSEDTSEINDTKNKN